MIRSCFRGAGRRSWAQVREAAGRLDGLLSGGKVRVLPMGEASAEFFRQATILRQAAGAPAMTVANARSAMCDLYDEGKSGTSRTLSPAEQIG
jgi:hypothetical protein